MKHSISFTIAAASLLLGCSRNEPEPTASTPAPRRVITDMLIGQWHGPEGTFLKIEGGEGKYQLIIQNLDGPRTFQGTATENGIQFERDGVTETITATGGAGTGMKWLADKKDCLVIRPGEGYCRNDDRGAVAIREVDGDCNFESRTVKCDETLQAFEEMGIAMDRPIVLLPQDAGEESRARARKLAAEITAAGYTNVTTVGFLTEPG